MFNLKSCEETAFQLPGKANKLIVLYGAGLLERKRDERVVVQCAQSAQHRTINMDRYLADPPQKVGLRVVNEQQNMCFYSIFVSKFLFSSTAL